MRKALDWIFPRYDEISVYLMTLVIATSAISDTDVRTGMLSMFAGMFNDDFFMGLFSVLVVVVILTAGLLLPFTHSDLRIFTFIVVVVHAGIMCIANFAWLISNRGSVIGDLINWIFALHGLAWLVVLRYRPSNDLISTRQATAYEALVAGPVFIVAMLVATTVFHVPWVFAYSIGFLGVTNLHSMALRAVERSNAPQKRRRRGT